MSGKTIWGTSSESVESLEVDWESLMVVRKPGMGGLWVEGSQKFSMRHYGHKRE